MPITKSARKAMRSAESKAAQNRTRKFLIKEATKNVTSETLPKAMSLIDKAVKWGIFHQNKAARLKSALSEKVTSKPGVNKTGATKTVASKPTKKTPAKAAVKNPAAKKPTVKKVAKK